jgi:hypothetical protein
VLIKVVDLKRVLKTDNDKNNKMGMIRGVFRKGVSTEKTVGHKRMKGGGFVMLKAWEEAEPFERFSGRDVKCLK